MRQAAAAAGVTLPVAIAPAPKPFFVPAVIEPQRTIIASGPASVSHKRRARRAREAAVELEIDGVAVKIACGADAGVIAAVIDVLKTAR